MTQQQRKYLTPDHPDAFVDFPPPLEHLHEPYKGKLPEGCVLCPKCKGHGGWNLMLFGYPKTPEDENRIRNYLRETPIGKLRHNMSPEEFRHNYVHFRSSCSQCTGWGYVNKGSKDETCLHEMAEISQEECHKQGISHFGMCWHVEQCIKCGQISSYDSSD